MSNEHYHYKFGQCEQCGIYIEESGSLTCVEFWNNDDDNDNSANYLFVCESCYDSRREWCKNLFSESCDWCKKLFDDDTIELSQLGGEYKNQKGVICYPCYVRVTDQTKT